MFDARVPEVPEESPAGPEAYIREPRHTKLFAAGDHGSKFYRIPALVTAADGSIIAVADRYLFHLQDPGNKFAPSDGSLRDFIDKYVEGVERTMAEIVRLGNIQREKMPGELANAGYFHLFQQVLFYYPDGKHKLHEWMKKEFRLWCDVIGRSVDQGELREEIDIQEAAALFRQVFIGLSYQMSFSDGLDVGILRKRFLYIYGLLKR